MTDATLRFDFLTMLDELEASLKRSPKEGYDRLGAHIEVADECAAGAESVVFWDIDQADIDMLRAALSQSSAARRIDLSSYVNAACIDAVDAPHIVVAKLQRAINAAPQAAPVGPAPSGCPKENAAVAAPVVASTVAATEADDEAAFLRWWHEQEKLGVEWAVSDRAFNAPARAALAAWKARTPPSSTAATDLPKVVGVGRLFDDEHPGRMMKVAVTERPEHCKVKDEPMLECRQDVCSCKAATGPELPTACRMLAEKWWDYANDKTERHPWASETLLRCSSELLKVLDTVTPSSTVAAPTELRIDPRRPESFMSEGERNLCQRLAEELRIVLNSKSDHYGIGDTHPLVEEARELAKAPASTVAARSEHRYGDAELTIDELVDELPKIRRFYSGSVFRTVQHDINMLCDAVASLVSKPSSAVGVLPSTVAATGETSRTDAEVNKPIKPGAVLVDAAFARQLERELADWQHTAGVLSETVKSKVEQIATLNDMLDATPASSIAATTGQRHFHVCKDHATGTWNEPEGLDDEDRCVLCRLFYLEEQETLLEEWQQRAKRAEDTIAEVERPLDVQMARLNETVTRLNEENERLMSPTARLRKDWHDDIGNVVWWRIPVDEPPWVGTPLDSDWEEGYYTHFTPLVIPANAR